MIGTTLGTYRIVALLGAGGMGEVYRAHDSKLGREVALKILPAAFSADPERRARFDREAKALATLNHPNIAQIFGVEDSTEIRALVMELVDGPTLEEVIRGIGAAGAEAPALHVDGRHPGRGRSDGDRSDGGQGLQPLATRRGASLSDALHIARQIADALVAAHEQGVIHRDLKPANVKVRDDGTVKVLDFGLARLTPGEDAAAPNAALSQSPTTMAPGATHAGMLLGTAAYMSPEQAKGRVADKRSDVWAFGCVFYELLTAERAFQGEDLSDILASVLKSEPDWSLLPKDLPDPVRTLLLRCLAKDRRMRVADVSVIQFVLAEVGPLSTSSSAVVPAALDSAAVHPQIDAAVSQAKRELLLRRVWPAAAVAAIAVAGVFAAGYSWLLPTPQAQPVTRLTIPQLVILENPAKPALSPDGQRLAYTSGGRVYQRVLSEFDARPVPGIEGALGATFLTYSPDGAFIAFASGAGGISRVPVGGGTPAPLCSAQAGLRGMSWHTTGIVFGQTTGIFRCGVAGGAPQQLVAAGENEVLYGPQILPDGDSLLLTVGQVSTLDLRFDDGAVAIHSMRTGQRKTLFTGGTDARYVSSGHILYAQGGMVMARPYDVDSATVGEPVTVVEGVRRPTVAISAAAYFVASDTGTLAYYPGPVQPASLIRTLALADRAGVITPIPVPPLPYAHVRATRDGRRLAMDSDDGKEAVVWIYELGSAAVPRKLTFGGRNRFPIWSPAGDRVAFQSDREGDAALWAQPVNGTGAVRLTTPEKGQEHEPESWSPDGQYIAYTVAGPSGPSLWVLSLADGRSSAFGEVRSIEPTGAAFSKDGRWLAYHVMPQGAAANSPNGGVFVEPFPRTGQLFQAQKLGRDFQPVWSQDGNGRELFYIPTAVSRQIAATRIIATTAGLDFAEPAILPAAVTGARPSGARRAFDVLPGGRFVGVVSPATDADLLPSEIRVVINWLEELKAKVPTGR